MPDTRPITDTHHIEKAERLVERVMGEHVLTDKQSKSWRFGRPGSMTYALWMTWTPGTLSIDGDIGSLTLTHYHAIGKDVRKALEWLSADAQYLLGKSDAKKEYDAEESAKALIASLNDRDLESLKSFREMMRDWRKQGLKLEPDGEVGDREDWLFWKPKREECNLYENWNLAGSELDLPQPDKIDGTSQHTWREEVANLIHDEADLGPVAFAELQHQLGIDEPCIIYTYPQQSWLQVAAMQKAARVIIAQMEKAEQGACP